MIINASGNTSHVKFVSYTGKWPNLCSGILTLNIDDEEVVFGYDYLDESRCDYPRFWTSGGNCGFSNNYVDSYVNESEWIIDEEELPEKYRKYVAEIDAVFNSNVRHGCCGGCL